MEERRLRIGSLFEWLAAALAVVLLVWVMSVPIQRALGPQVEAALIERPTALPPGVPVDATSVPLILLLDGREIRQGDLMSHVDCDAPGLTGRGAAAPQHAASSANAARAPTSPTAPTSTSSANGSSRVGRMKVSGIYLP